MSSQPHKKWPLKQKKSVQTEKAFGEKKGKTKDKKGGKKSLRKIG